MLSMVLYEIKESNSQKVKVYNFEAGIEDIINYRIQQMETIPENERFFVAEACVNLFKEIPVFVPYMQKWCNPDAILNAYYADNENRRYDNDYLGYHVLKKDFSNKDAKLALLKSYLYDSHDESKPEKTIVPIEYSKNLIKYFLIMQGSYQKIRENWNNTTYWLENIIQLPESLYFLQLLEHGKFSLLKDKDISEQLNLYSLVKVKEYNLADFYPNDAFAVVHKAQKDDHILRRLRK